MVAVIVCREMHWTYDQYQDAPHPFIKNILAMMQAEADARAKQK